MVYSKKGYRKYKKYYKRYSKKNSLTKGNIFGHKNAKSQAKQIYKLNKKINKIQYLTKPETIVKSGELVNIWNTSNGQLGGTLQSEKHSRWYLYEEGLFGKLSYNIKGNLIRTNNITLYGYFGVRDLIERFDDENYDVDPTAYLRITVAKVGANSTSLPSIIHQSFDTTNPNGDYGLINGPLIKDVSASLKIIKDKVVKVSPETPKKLWRIKLKYPGNYRKGVASSGNPNWYNEYIVYFTVFVPRLLQVFNSSSQLETLGPHVNLAAGMKFVFVDEN